MFYQNTKSSKQKVLIYRLDERVVHLIVLALNIEMWVA